MGWFDGFSQNDDYQQTSHASVYEERQHKSNWSHELVGGAAGFEAMRLYEQHEAANGQPQNHQIAKEILAGIAAAEVDKLFETKGLDTSTERKRSTMPSSKHTSCTMSNTAGAISDMD